MCLHRLVSFLGSIHLASTLLEVNPGTYASGISLAGTKSCLYFFPSPRCSCDGKDGFRKGVHGKKLGFIVGKYPKVGVTKVCIQEDQFYRQVLLNFACHIL